MAVSRDNRQYDVTTATCFNTLLALLPMLHVRIEPFASAALVIESQNAEKGEIRLKAEAPTTPTSLPKIGVQTYYRFKVNVEDSSSAGKNMRCTVKVEATTAGVTDVGLGQITLRQLLITLSLALSGKLPPGTLPVFFIELNQPPLNSAPGLLFERVNRGFELSKKGLGDDAVNEWGLALAINPNTVEVYFHKGVLLLLLEQLEEARQNFEMAVRLDPHHLLAKPYLDDTSLKLQKQKSKVSTVEPTAVLSSSQPGPVVKSEDLPTGQMATPPPGLAAGSGVAPGSGRSHVNEEELPTQTIKISLRGRLLLKGEGIPFTEFELKRMATTLGRQEGNDILLLDGKVSRRHADIISVGGGTLLVDLGSANGSYLNGRRLAPNEQAKLQQGDKIMLGDVEITFTLPGAATTDAPTAKTRRMSNVPNAAERAWALEQLGLNPAPPPTPAQIEAQFETFQKYWQGRLNESPTLKLRSEAEQGLADLQKARDILSS